MIMQFLRYYKPYKRLFALDFTCAIIAALLELGFPLAVNVVVDQLLPQKDWLLILGACAILLAIYVVNAGLQYIVTYWGHMLGVNIETDMRSILFEHVQKLSFRFFDNHHTGRLTAGLTTDLLDIGELAHHGPEDVFIAVMTLIGAFGLMFLLNARLALLAFVVIPILTWLVIVCNQKMTKNFAQFFANISDFNARLGNSIGGIRVVQAFSNEKAEIEQFAINNRRFRETKLRSYKIMGLSSAASFMLMRLVSIFIVICGAWFVIHEALSYGEFVAFLLLSNVFFRPIEKINAVIETYPKGIAGFRRYMQTLEVVPDIVDAPDAIDIDDIRGMIKYSGVTFGYEKKAAVLQNIDLEIRPGETVAFVGPSGAGKTTLCSLLPRFYEVDAGTITIDGIDIRTVKLASLRKQIGIVQQDVFLFPGTIRENIAYGKLRATELEIWEAARCAQLETFINSLPDGLDTVIGERGVKLSGGQKQRLAIARMFLKNPPILILDEATSALDTETEAGIQQALVELSVGRTTLIIAHRLATVKNADRIVVVTEQGISEQGRHEELVRAGGLYSRLSRAQYGI
jgi:ATP-binding cassette subfamily B protein